MSDQSQSGTWVNSDAWLDQLSDDLSDDDMVVAAPEIQHVALSGVVVIPQGLIVLHARDWVGDIIPSAVGLWRQKKQTGGANAYPNPMKALHSSEQALRHFMHEEFPDLRITIVQLIVLTNPGARIVGRPLVGNMLVIPLADLAQEINALVDAIPGDRLGRPIREELAKALVERKLTRYQRATTPFVFRSGSFLGGNRKAWTLTQLFEHMDSNPADGIYHMRNGTLENWLTNQGAFHMARLVHEVTNEAGRDPRAVLETLITRSGLVKHHGIIIHPRKLDLGRVLAGYDCADSITVRSGSRHGYVVGSLDTSESWLRVEPKQISGNDTKVAIRVDTTKLPIQARPFHATITLTSELAAKPIVVPIKVRVVVEPSNFVRFVLRPLIGAIIAGTVGTVLGLLLGIYGVNPPQFLSNLMPSLDPIRIWMLITGVFWMIWGIVRGLQQPLSLPIDIWLLRWFAGTLLWMIPFGLTALATVWMLGVLPGSAPLINTPVRYTIMLGALVLAIVPAVLDHHRAFTTGHSITNDTLNTHRPFVVTLIAISLAVLVFAGLLYVPNLWRSEQVQTTKAGTQSWIVEQYTVTKDKIDKWIETYYMQRFDRRVKVAPSPTATVKRPTATPTK